MRVVDLHCDTLFKAVTEHTHLDDEAHEVHPEQRGDSRKLQCYAIWLPDSYSGEQAEATVLTAAKVLQSECRRINFKLLCQGDDVAAAFEQHRNTAFFTIENGLALNGKIENIAKFAALGVRMMTLTWNAANQIGGGADAPKTGLTDFGKEAVREMERQKITVDISHASERLFYDVAAHTSLPFVASHSNAYSVTPHRRNLTDDQIKLIIRRGGLFGLNFHSAFLNGNPDSACTDDILRHAEHFLSLGGENCLCFGSDFDGGILPKDIHDSSVYDNIYEMMLRHGYKETLIEKIFFRNALNFFENFDNPRKM